MLNAKVAIGALGLDCRYDLFHNRMLVAGELINKWNSTELSDHVTTMIRDVIRYKFGFDPKKDNTRDACEALCLSRRFDPILDYLDSLRWDGVPRLDRWMATYLGAADSELTRAFGRLSLLAAVRRARSPGTKFDQIIVLEGPQGAGKSEAVCILAGSDNFSDQKILGVDDRKQQELTEGVWLYEIAELTGLRRAEVEHVKAFVSRAVDRARPAYGRYTVSQPRRTVFFATTNPGQPYLQDETGNRRFWPVVCGRIDLQALARDRDQIWAEAAAREATGESHMLAQRLWDAAAEQQSERLQADEWAVHINNYLALKARDDVSITEVLSENQFLQIDAAHLGLKEQTRAAAILRGLGFVRYRKREGRALHWRFRRSG
jgi:predicted P-loop ATPase